MEITHIHFEQFRIYLFLYLYVQDFLPVFSKHLTGKFTHVCNGYTYISLYKQISYAEILLLC